MTDHIHHYEPFHDAPATEVCTVCGDERPAFGVGA